MTISLGTPQSATGIVVCTWRSCGCARNRPASADDMPRSIFGCQWQCWMRQQGGWEYLAVLATSAGPPSIMGELSGMNGILLGNAAGAVPNGSHCWSSKMYWSWSMPFVFSSVYLFIYVSMYLYSNPSTQGISGKAGGTGSERVDVRRKITIKYMQSGPWRAWLSQCGDARGGNDCVNSVDEIEPDWRCIWEATIVRIWSLSWSKFAACEQVNIVNDSQKVIDHGWTGTRREWSSEIWKVLGGGSWIVRQVLRHRISVISLATVGIWHGDIIVWLLWWSGRWKSTKYE